MYVTYERSTGGKHCARIAVHLRQLLLQLCVERSITLFLQALYQYDSGRQTELFDLLIYLIAVSIAQMVLR
jgi:hypothetical protein